ncbi:hypothetical protein HKD37_11G032229 [Glycine soja]
MSGSHQLFSGERERAHENLLEVALEQLAPIRGSSSSTSSISFLSPFLLIMASPPASLPPPPPAPSDASASPSAMKRTHKASRLRSLSTRPPGAERPVVHVDPAIGKADGPHRKKLRTYLGIVARDKVDVTYENWKEVPTPQKDLIWEDIKAEFEIPEASNSRTKRKLLQTVGERWRKWALAADLDGVEDTVCEKYGIRKEKWAQFCQTRRDPSWEDVRKKAQAIQKQNTTPHVLSRGGYDYLEQKLLAEKTKKKLEEVAQTGSVDGIIDPPSPVRCHVKWKMARTKKSGDMTTEAAKEIVAKIDSFEDQATQGSFVPHGRQDVLAAAIGRPEYPGRVRAVGAGVTIKQYFGSAPRTSCSSSSLISEELDQLEESITERVTRQVMASYNQMQSQIQSQMQTQGLALPLDPLVGPFGPRVSTKGSCVDPSGNDPETGDSDRCGLYIETDPARLVALGRVYEGSTVVHNTPLLPGQVKVVMEEVTDADAPVPVPTDEDSLVGQALHTFLAWPTYLVKSLSQQIVVSLPKPPPKPDQEVNDPLYLMTLTIPELFLRPYQVTWDATVFGVFNPNFSLYIKHKDLSGIAYGEESITEKVMRQLMASFSQMQSQGLALPPEPLVGPSGPRVSTKVNCVDPSGNDPKTGHSDRCGLYIETDPARLVTLGRVYEGSTIVHNTPLLSGQVKVGVEEVTDADAPVPVPTDEVSLVGQILHTFLAWSTHLVKSLSQQVVVSLPKPPPKPDPEVDDPLYLMTLTIPELFLRPYQVTWDATVFGVFNPHFSL